MTPDQLPIGQTIVFAQSPQFRQTLTRINSDTLESIHYDQSTNDETLKMHLHLDGSAELVSLDRVYWILEVDGRPATQADMDDIIRKRSVAANIDANERRLTFVTRRPAA
jgi:hypothetical protein